MTSVGNVVRPPVKVDAQRAKRKRKSGSATPYWLIAPTVILLLTLFAYPIFNVFFLSFQHYNISTPWSNGPAGFSNYVQMFSDPVFKESLYVTVKWVGIQVALQFLFGLILALVVNETFIGRGLARAMLFSPWAVSGILTSTIWLLLLNPGSGIGRYLADIGIGSYGASMLSGSESAFWAATMAELWRGVPFFTILILADLQSVPKELHEAAQVDGAGSIRRFFYITLPHLRYAILLAVLLRTVWEFNNVDLLYTLTGGGPAGATTTLPLYVAQVAIDSKNFGYGSALTIVGFLILSVFTLIYLRITKFGQETQ